MQKQLEPRAEEREKSEGKRGDVTTREKDKRNICQVVREFAFSQFRPMECPRLPVRRVELLDEVKREKSKRESCLAVRAFKIAQEGFQRTERRENHLLVAPATDNSLRLTGLGYWTMAKRYHTDVCCPFERQL